MKRTVEKTVAPVLISSPAPLFFRRMVVFFLCCAIFFVSQFYRTANAVIAPQLQRDLSLTPESLGFLSAAFFYAFASMQIPLALFLDRLGARLIVTVLTLTGSLGACLFALSHGLYGGLLGRGLLGLGMAANFMGPLKLFTRWFSPKEFATVSGLLVGFGTLGNIASNTPLAMLVEIIGWRWTFMAFGVSTALLAILFYLVVRDTPYKAEMMPVVGQQESGPGTGVGVLLRSRDYWLISCGTFFRYGTFMAIQALWAGPYMIEVLHMTPVAAGNILLLGNVGYIVGCSLGGWLSDVFSSRKYIVWMGLTGMAVVEFTLSAVCGQSRLVLLPCLFFSLGLFAGFGNVMYAHIKGIMPSEMSGMALTGINFFTMLGVGVYIHIMGWVLDYVASGSQAGPEGYRVAFFMTFVGVAVAAAGYLFTHESKE